jgi:aminopeptidase N
VAFYDVTFTAPADMVIVTSGDILTNTIHADGQQTIHAYSGPMRDFFVALSADYQSLNQEVDGIIVTSYFPAGYEEGGRMALQVAGQALDIFDNLFGPYPYRAFDIAVSPMPAALGGLEFPGVIVMAQRYYNRPNAAFEFVLAHEVSHQWWYGLVGNDQANYPWLDEALTQYSAVNYFEQRHGPHKRPELVDQNFWFPYNQLLATNADRPVAGPVADFSETMYSSVVYGKGPLFFEHLRDHLGDPRYFAGLRTYAKTHRYGVAAPDDLLAAFNQAGGQDVTWLYRQWILGE